MITSDKVTIHEVAAALGKHIGTVLPWRISCLGEKLSLFMGSKVRVFNYARSYKRDCLALKKMHGVIEKL